MKYLVMECHSGYAVLMDEDSRFVTAANMHYEVGQTVTDPVLLETESRQKSGMSRIIMRAVGVSAAAACLVLAGFTGYRFFRPDKPAPHSVVFVSDAAEIEMQLDKNGSVVKLTSDSECGNQIIEKYIESHGRTSDRVDTANDLLALQINDGYISSGDTVEVYIPESSSGCEEYKAEFENKMADLDIKVDIKEVPKPHLKREPPKAPAAPAAPAGAPEGSKPEPAHETKRAEELTTAADVQQPSEPEAPADHGNGNIKPGGPAGHQQHEPPAPPAEPERPTAGADIKGHEPPAPPTPAPAEPKAPVPDEQPAAPTEQPGRAEPHHDELPEPVPRIEIHVSQ